MIFTGTVLNSFQQKMIKSLVRNSTHPLSLKIYNSLETNDFFPVTKFDEIPGFGIRGVVYGNLVKVGSKEFIVSKKLKMHLSKMIATRQPCNQVFVSINDEVLGYFTVTNSYREGIADSN